MFKLYII